MTRRIARFQAVAAVTTSNLVDRLAPQSNGEVQALPRLLEGRKRFDALPQLIADDAEIEGGLALSEINGQCTFEILLRTVQATKPPFDHTRQDHDGGIRHERPRSIGVCPCQLKVVQPQLVPRTPVVRFAEQPLPSVDQARRRFNGFVGTLEMREADGPANGRLWVMGRDVECRVVRSERRLPILPDSEHVADARRNRGRSGKRVQCRLESPQALLGIGTGGIFEGVAAQRIVGVDETPSDVRTAISRSRWVASQAPSAY